MHAGGQAPFPLATMVFSSRECRKSQGMPACCQMGWGAEGQHGSLCRQWVPCSYPTFHRDSPMLAGINLSLLPQQCSGPHFLGCHVSVT